MAYRLSVVETGTWNPTLIGGSVAGMTTYTTQNGYYEVLGDIVIARFVVTITAATGTGDARIGGLPKPINASSIDFTGPMWINAVGWAWPAGTTSICSLGVAGNSFVTAICSASAVAGSALQMTNAACSLTGSLVYRL